MTALNASQVKALMRWYVDAGVDETVSETPTNWFEVTRKLAEARAAAKAETTPPSKSPAPRKFSRAPAKPADIGLPMGAEEAIKDARGLAASASTVAKLGEAIVGFGGCPLKKTATNTCFIDGNPDAKILLIGEGPGAEEDRQGKPFVGPSGVLLDKMLASIDLNRERVLISNTVFWRPPGNRTPTTSEAAMCMPFVERLIELVTPDVLIVLGGAAAKVLLNEAQGIGRLRGRWFDYGSETREKPIPAMALFHPAYLLRSPAQKKEAWGDLLMLRERLET